MTIDNLFKEAVKKKASDVHIIVGMPPVFRIDGSLITQNSFGKVNAKAAADIINSLFSEKQRQAFEEQKELDLSYEIDGLLRFRVNVHQEKGYLGLVARVIPAKIPTLEDLQTPKIIYDLINLNQGLILVTGPTGCGKSTSLAAIIDYINNNRSANIITLEDPIEFIFQPNKSIIKQRQLHTDMISFQNALIHVLRQDPNVIMVGEMRDLETIATTITLAETGHLVFATLHTHNSAQTIDRIIDIFPSHQQAQIRLQLSMTLRGIVSQRLVPKADGGRLAIREVLINTPAISNLIRENKIAQIKTVVQTSAKEGMFTMDQDIVRLYGGKLIDEQVAKFNISSHNLLKK
ncbi:type IV pilus twitching motility protein PilT [Candidatus Parcubacteria bacterium]|nr:MAG: type IV pilus twitching motility protein PilT [Candidatus Parcubacteria bacterium]